MLSRRALQLQRVVASCARPASNSAVSSSKITPPTPAHAVSDSIAPQAPNYAKIWSKSQRPRPVAASSPRFEQTLMELQPQPLSAMELIANVPVITVQGRRADCDGGGGPLGHPKIYINLDTPGNHACGYCGLRYEQAPHHH